MHPIVLLMVHQDYFKGYVVGPGQVYVNDHPQWVKVVSARGAVHHQPWSRVYNDMKHSAGITAGGYVP